MIDSLPTWSTLVSKEMTQEKSKSWISKEKTKHKATMCFQLNCAHDYFKSRWLSNFLSFILLLFYSLVFFLSEIPDEIIEIDIFIVCTDLRKESQFFYRACVFMHVLGGKENAIKLFSSHEKWTKNDWWNEMWVQPLNSNAFASLTFLTLFLFFSRMW